MDCQRLGTLILKGVRHVLDSRLNIVSVGKLNGDGYHNWISNGQWKSTKGTLVVAKGHMCCTLHTTHWKLHKSELVAIMRGSIL